MFGIRGGCFHRDDGTLRPREWATPRWIVCELRFKGRRRSINPPGRYTQLFFLDEAVAFAAGHRPCFECRRASADLYQRLWQRALGLETLPSADAMDAVLTRERLLPPDARPTARIGDLPDGAVVVVDGVAQLVRGGAVRAWSFGGYGPPRRLAPKTPVALLTPQSTVAILAAGYAPRLHGSAQWRSAE
ncbi:MAG: hypothetical protein RL291_1776 [Pseudomonadota bacterium]